MGGNRDFVEIHSTPERLDTVADVSAEKRDSAGNESLCE